MCLLSRYGCIIALSGTINMFQPAIDAMNHNVFHDNPIPINAFLASLGFFVGTSLVLYVAKQTKVLKREQEARRTDFERHMVIHEEDCESEYAVSFLDLSSS